MNGNVHAIVDMVVKSYSNKFVARALLSAIALEVGALPDVRRLACQFGNKRKYKERPMLTLRERNPSIYLLGWREGDCTEAHDHGQSEVGIYVVQGIVTEDIYVTMPRDAAGNKYCVCKWSRQIFQGDLMNCPTHYIHKVSNLYPEVAATLHVYGPVLGDMCIYEEIAGSLRFKEHWHNEDQRPQH